MLIKQLDKAHIDVFTGNGWEGWSRFNIEGNIPKLVKGQSLTTEEYKEVLNATVRVRSVQKRKSA